MFLSIIFSLCILHTQQIKYVYMYLCFFFADSFPIFQAMESFISHLGCMRGLSPVTDEGDVSSYVRFARHNRWIMTVCRP